MFSPSKMMSRQKMNNCNTSRGSKTNTNISSSTTTHSTKILPKKNKIKVHMKIKNDFLKKYQVTVPSAIVSLHQVQKNVLLQNDYHPNEFSIICGRGRGAYNKPGNKRFRQIVKEYIPEYLQAKTKVEKSYVINKIIDVVKQNPAQGNGNVAVRFVKYHKENGWYEISEDQAREKVGHTIRESMALVSDPDAHHASDTKTETTNTNTATLAAAATVSNNKNVVLFERKQHDLLTKQKSIFETLRTPAPMTPSPTTTTRTTISPSRYSLKGRRQQQGQEQDVDNSCDLGGERSSDEMATILARTLSPLPLMPDLIQMHDDGGEDDNDDRIMLSLLPRWSFTDHPHIHVHGQRSGPPPLPPQVDATLTTHVGLVTPSTSTSTWTWYSQAGNQHGYYNEEEEDEDGNASEPYDYRFAPI